ncbi:hypothetical protein [Flavobacterium poyangense]|uniref:hypothetical protein n=1 Tax=Flavobacterium poyangense TaxID=2204302 RepID=UPI0014238864|nr:hypothetical protein [Flavobacterium sp. JXAS1]
MIKLYKTIHNQLNYWEIWQIDEKTALTYWGTIGKIGQYEEVKSSIFANFSRTIKNKIKTKRKEGYKEFDENKFSVLLIEYKNHPCKTENDLEKQYKLEEWINHLLELRSLGYCNIIGNKPDTIKIECTVTDHNIAKNVINEELQNTEFADYTQILKKSKNLS